MNGEEPVPPQPNPQAPDPALARPAEKAIRWVDQPPPEPQSWENLNSFLWEDVIDYYDLLEVSPKASCEVIRKAFQALALKYHPDRQPPERRPEAERLMRILNQARDTLLDEENRKAYNQKTGRAPGA